MPRKSAKAKLIDDIYYTAATNLLQLDSSDDSEDDKVHQRVNDEIELVLLFHNGEFKKVPKQCLWLSEVLPNYDEGRFRQVVRLSHSQFDTVFNLIKDNPVFHTQNLQMPTSVQLAITLYRFGIYGTGAGIHNISRIFGIGDGSTVTRITRRVIRVLLQLKNRFIFWPNAAEREQIVAETYNCLPRCIGWIDGTHICLEEAPKYDKDSYYNKDKRYSLQLQLICDQNKRIRHFVVGYPGSVHDSRVWMECQVIQNTDKYFSDDQWISGDSGYGLSKFIITPFRQNSPGLSHKRINQFNLYYSQQRIKIEHVNGALKETFSSLKELRVPINDAEGHKNAVQWIEACLVLYNITMPLENWIEPKGMISVDYNDGEELAQEDDFTAADKRMALFHHIMDKLD